MEWPAYQMTKDKERPYLSRRISEKQSHLRGKALRERKERSMREVALSFCRILYEESLKTLNSDVVNTIESLKRGITNEWECQSRKKQKDLWIKNNDSVSSTFLLSQNCILRYFESKKVKSFCFLWKCNGNWSCFITMVNQIFKCCQFQCRHRYHYQLFYQHLVRKSKGRKVLPERPTKKAAIEINDHAILGYFDREKEKRLLFCTKMRLPIS